MRSGNDLKILFKNSPNDSILIKNGVINASYVIEKLLFDNGDMLTIDELRAMTLIGDDGNDTINGYGDDTYIFNLGDGADTISESGGVDTIKFGEGISKEEITFKRISNDLVLKYGADESVKINSYFSNNNYKVEKVELDSGEFITSSQIDKIIEQVNTYAKDNGITSFTNDDMRNNSAMMQIVMSGWGN